MGPIIFITMLAWKYKKRTTECPLVDCTHIRGILHCEKFCDLKIKLISFQLNKFGKHTCAVFSDCIQEMIYMY